MVKQISEEKKLEELIRLAELGEPLGLKIKFLYFIRLLRINVNTMLKNKFFSLFNFTQLGEVIQDISVKSFKNLILAFNGACVSPYKKRILTPKITSFIKLHNDLIADDVLSSGFRGR